MCLSETVFLTVVNQLFFLRLARDRQMIFIVAPDTYSGKRSNETLIIVTHRGAGIGLYGLVGTEKG